MACRRGRKAPSGSHCPGKRLSDALQTHGLAVTIVLGPTFNQITYLVVGFAMGLSAQCVKICVDTTVQQTVDDAYMGRVFSLYDMLYNVAYVVGPAIAAPFLVETGKSYPLVVAIGALYLAAGFGYAALTIRRKPPAALPAASFIS